MIAILDQGQGHAIPGKMFDQGHGMRPRHVGILHALKNMHRRMRIQRRAQQEIAATILDQRARDRIGIGRIGAVAQPDALGLDLLAHFGGHVRPHQRFGEIDRRGDQDEAGQPLACFFGTHCTRGEQRNPAPHRRADDDLRAGRLGADQGKALGKPARNDAILETPAGFAMAGIIEAQAGATLAGRESIQSLRLGGLHVGLEAAEPDNARTLRQGGRGRTLPKSDLAPFDGLKRRVICVVHNHIGHVRLYLALG